MSTYIRREIRSLSILEWGKFVAAVKKTNVRTLLLPTAYDNFSKNYATKFSTFNQYDPSNPLSGLNAYRKFLIDFEQVLQNTDPDIALPYWDITIDSYQPEQSLIFSNSYMGGTFGRNGTVADGAFAGWQVGYPGLLEIVPLVHILRRHYNNGSTISSWPTAELVSSLISNSNTLADINQKLIHSLLGPVFNGIGGDLTTTNSPNDPIFWVVACFVDTIYQQWLTLHPEVPQPIPINYTYS